ncbi:NAD-dependent deacetylase, partial [Microvirga sp. 3-52]|nr:NAD-dependent deacetylase [Microvirga sp. 3-52]
VEESEKADLFIVLGSSLTVTPANQFPLIAKENGAKLLIVNMDPTHFDDLADVVINDQKIGEVLAEIDRHLVKK